ncbi:hypothetical protein FIBSPDRAFT_1025828 [Athelia psychrophila]|uniref:Uncharacterized protein n=1 Tax=Athelia psychrophila TaxID=1759441 RepID=A0A166HLC2_9AGAM|nr:hypothetical protein FIBSPDRAFT_1025828 [Fibularhizoctonia sp. CBS 109695]
MGNRQVTEQNEHREQTIDRKGLDAGAYTSLPTWTSPPVPIPVHPFANSKSLLVVIPATKLMLKKETKLYGELCVAQDDEVAPTLRGSSSPAPLSIFSKVI